MSKWKSIINLNEIEKVRIKRNIAHLSQVEEILFTTPLLVKVIDKDGCTTGTDSILDGTFNPPK